MAIGPITHATYTQEDKDNSIASEQRAQKNKRWPEPFFNKHPGRGKRARTIKPLLGENPSQLLSVAAEKLKLVLRSPKLADADFIKMNLYTGIIGYQKNLAEEELDILISEGTYTKQGCVHEMTIVEDGSHQLIGAIHFDTSIDGVKQGKAHIHSTDVLPGCQGKGVGTLLLSSALQAIHARGGDKVTLKTTDEGIFLYAAFSFQPKQPKEIPQNSWIKMPYPVKVKVLNSYWNESSGNLLLDLTSDRVKEAVANRFHTLLKEKETKTELDLSQIALPEEIFSWGILQDTRSLNE